MAFSMKIRLRTDHSFIFSNILRLKANCQLRCTQMVCDEMDTIYLYNDIKLVVLLDLSSKYYFFLHAHIRVHTSLSIFLFYFAVQNVYRTMCNEITLKTFVINKIETKNEFEFLIYRIS